MDEVQGKVNAAETTLEAVDLSTEQLDELTADQDAVTAAKTSLGALETARDTALDNLNAKKEQLEDVKTSIGAIEDDIDADKDKKDQLDPDASDYVDQIKSIEDDITELEGQKEVLEEQINGDPDVADDDGLAGEVEQLQKVYDDADAVVKDAEEDLADAEQTLADFTSDSAISAYLDAKADLETANAEYDYASTHKAESIFQKIWNRIIDFFINLVAGEQYEAGVTDIVYTGSAIGFTNDEETSECAFSLKNQERSLSTSISIRRQSYC